ncbi:MAG: DEAD/DEAH box helicase [Tepidisphaeraceae bacterium]
MDNEPSYRWQQYALSAWEKAGRRGIIEAVTGSGKTHVGIEALLKAYTENRKLSSLVIVPTVPLMEQWHGKICDVIRSKFPNERVGRIGGDFRDRFAVPPIAYVATITSALRHADDRFGQFSAKGLPTLLIADECHHYIDAPVWRKIVEDHDWTYCMGLSATIEPNNTSGLGSILYAYRFTDAHRDGLVPSFDLLNSSVELTHEEREDYFNLSEKIRAQFSHVCELYKDELRSSSDEWLFKRLQRLMGRIGSGREPQIEKLYLLLFRRAAIHYKAQNKLDIGQEAIHALVESGRKVLVFFERIAAADLVDERIDRAAARALKNQVERTAPHVWCKVCHSGMSPSERAAILSEFRSEGPSALLVCRSFDEGIDIPEVDAGILVASTQSKRQRIQRIGRTLRRGDGNKRPIILTLYAKGTSDGVVTAEDHAGFRGVATIHESSGKAAISKLRALIPGSAAVSEPNPATSHSPKGSLIFAGDPLDATVLPAQLTKFVKKGVILRIVYESGEVVEGRFDTCLSYAVRISGKDVPVSGVREVYSLS